MVDRDEKDKKELVWQIVLILARLRKFKGRESRQKCRVPFCTEFFCEREGVLILVDYK